MAEQNLLCSFEPQHDFFVGFDSDGTVFDTMEIKQKECFCPNNIKYWGLQPVAKYAREVSEFVNLYSRWRGVNRFPALLKIFDFLAEREEVKARGFQVPEAKSLRAWVASGVPLGTVALKEAIERTGDPVLENTLAWTEAVNQAVAEMVYGIPPFPFVRESMEELKKRADLMCVSQTPAEALTREWAEHDLTKYVRLIAGQELGSKKEHLRLAAVGKYQADHILLIGDAYGDLEAAKANGVLFYPINPGHEEDSWQRFYEEAMGRFFDGTYAGGYEENLIAEFLTYLPETPPWRKEKQ